MTIIPGGFVLNPVTGRFAQTVTVTNTTPPDIIINLTGPISLVLDGLSPDATLFNATGVTDAGALPAGSPYLNANTALAVGQSVTFQLQFADPTRGAITYTPPGARRRRSPVTT